MMPPRSPRAVPRVVPILGLWLISLAGVAGQETDQEQPAAPEQPALEEGRGETAASEGAASEAAASERQTGGTRAGGTPSWRVRARSGSEASIEFPTGYRDTARVAIARAQTGVRSHIRLALVSFPVSGGQTYEVRLKARADGPRSISTGLVQVDPPYANIGSAVQFNITPVWKSYLGRFRVERDVESAGLAIGVGGNRYSVEVTDVRVLRVPDGEVIAAGPTDKARLGEGKGRAGENGTETGAPAEGAASEGKTQGKTGGAQPERELP